MRYHTPKELLEYFIFILPLALFLTFFTLYPVGGTIVTSFFRDTTFLEKKFIFLQNYLLLFGDKAFYQSLTFTILFVCISVPLELILGMAFALLMNAPLPFRGFFTASLLIPWVIPASISGRIFELIYNYNYGLANFFVLAAGFAEKPVHWLGSESGAFFALLLADIWKTTPFVAIILLAGLKAIPGELYRQAEIDRTNFFQRFTRITLPLLKPVIVVALLFRTIDAVRIFDAVYVITGGGPGGSTTSLSLYAYRYFLAGDFGYGSLISVLLFLISLALGLLYLKVSRFKEAIR